MTTTSSPTRSWMLRLLLGIGLMTVAALAMAVILVAIPATRRLIAVVLTERMLGGQLESLAVDLDIRPQLRWIFTLGVILPVGLGLTRMVMARQLSSAIRGLGLAAGTLLALALGVWWHTRHFNFDAKGRPVVYLSFRRDGAHRSYSPGVDRVTGRPKYEATVDRVEWLSKLARQAVREVDPAADTNWFEPNSGEPNLWYVMTGGGEWQFFNRPHFHQQLRVEVLPVTPEVMACWQAEHGRRTAAAQALQRQREAEAKAVAEQREREERDRAEHRRQADLRIRAEAEALARREAGGRERAGQRAREEQNHRAVGGSARSGAGQPKQERRAAEVASHGAVQLAMHQRPGQIARHDSAGVWTKSSPTPRWPQTPPSFIPTLGWTEQPAASRRLRTEERILQPVVTVVTMPFRVVGAILGGLANPCESRQVPVFTTPSRVPPCGTVSKPPRLQTYTVPFPPVVWRPSSNVPPPGVPVASVRIWSVDNQ